MYVTQIRVGGWGVDPPTKYLAGWGHSWRRVSRADGVREARSKGGAVLGVADYFHENPGKKSCEIFFNQSLTDPDEIFNHDPDCDENFRLCRNPPFSEEK